MAETVSRVRQILQIALAAVGGAVAALGLGGMATVPFLIEDRFASGLAILFFAVHALGGFVLLSIGLLIPQPRNVGIHFTADQRKLLLWGAIGPILSVLGYLIGINVLPSLSGLAQTATVGLFVVILLSGPVATLVAIGLKLRSRSGR